MKHFFMLGLALAAMLPYQAFSQKHSSPAPAVAAKVAPGGGGGPIIPQGYCAEPISGLQAHVDSIYAPLDKTPIPYGVLYNRASQQANLLRFNAQAPDTSSARHFRQVLYELHTTAYDATLLPCQADVRDYARQSSDRDTALIGMLHYGFGYLDSTAVANNLVYYDTNSPALLHDVPGRPRSPYLSREATVMAALLDTSRFGVLRFRLDTRLCYTNMGRTLSSVNVDFADGNGPQNLLPNQTRTITYSSIGNKILTYTIYFTDGSQRVTRSSLYVSSIGAHSKGGFHAKNIRPAVASCFFQPLTANITYSRNQRAGLGEAEYYYSTSPLKNCNQTQQDVTKPVILIDGFDHEDDRKAGNIYADKLVYSTINGNVSQEHNLADELRQQGYDVVILNFPRVITGYTLNGFFLVPQYYRGGSAYIEANAYVLVKLIQELNTQLTRSGSAEKLVIVGPSMGGQIAKYALAYMETNSLVHNTRLYVSLDSPHNGANTPIGPQLFLKYFGEDIGQVSARDALGEINSPASKQLSQQHYSQLSGNTVPFQQNGERTIYQTNLTNVGSWPQQVRRIAIANGSLTAQRQLKTFGSGTIADGDQAFYLRGKALGIGIASARMYFAQGYGNSQKVLEGHYPIGRGRNYYALGPPSSCGRDAGPGGWFDVQQSVVDKASDRRGAKLTTFYSVQRNSAFVPMHSALAYQPAGGGADDYCQSLAASNLVCDGTIPFDAYYGPRGDNEEHIQLTSNNVDFIRNEILKITPSPILTASVSEVCAGGVGRTFSVQAECVQPGRNQPVTTYTWTVEPGAHFSNGLLTATGASVSLFGDAGVDADVTVTVRATRTGYAASTPVTIRVYVSDFDYFDIGAQAPIDPVSANNYVICHDEILNYSLAMRGYDLSSIRWFTGEAGQEVPTTSYNGQQFNGSTTIAIHALHNARYFSVYATATSICTGQTNVVSTRPPNNFNYRSPAGGLVLMIDNNCLPHRQALPGEAAPISPTVISAYPNPANGSLLVQLNTSDAAMSRATVRLYNGQGGLVREQAATGAQCTFATADLPAGIYYLVVAGGTGKALRQHLEIKH